jgi:hypothetical protein
VATGIRTQVARGAVGAVLLGLAGGCGDPAAERQEPTHVDLAALPEAELAGRVLDECQGPLRGGMHSVFAIVTLPDGGAEQVAVELPAALRTAGPAGQFVLNGGEAAAIGAAPRPATPAETAHLLALRELLAVATLDPLRHATSCRRVAAAAVALGGAEGSATRLELRPGTLLPQRFVFSSGAVTIDDWLRTPVAWMPARLTHPRLGTCQVRFERSGVRWEPDHFAPATPAPPSLDDPARIRIAAGAIQQRSAAPQLEAARATNWLVLDDPGDWAERAAVYRPLQDALLTEGQQIAGFPILTRIDGRDAFVIPFRPRSGTALPPVAASRRVLQLAAGHELVVHPTTGDFAERRAEGERLLRAALAAQGLEADGAIRCQPWLHLDEGTPDAAALAAPTVRMSVRLR